MAEILGLGCTHRPVMLRRNEDWTGMMRTSLDDPDMPAEMKDPASWPPQLREELGNDFGAAAAGRAREVYRRHFAVARAALDEFKPDVIVMFGDDQYENFKEDIVPPFAVLAYDQHEVEPWKNRAWNPWGEPNDRRFSYKGHRAAGKYLASGLLERHRRRLRLPAPSCSRPCLRLYAVAARRRAARVWLPGRAVLGELLRPARQHGARAAAAARCATRSASSIPFAEPGACMAVGAPPPG
jgi:hypothetical protein